MTYVLRYIYTYYCMYVCVCVCTQYEHTYTHIINVIGIPDRKGIACDADWRDMRDISCGRNQAI